MTRRQSFKAILFSAFAFALTVVVATDALAQLRTRTGGSTYPGSSIGAAIKFWDETAQITPTGDGFFNILAATAGEQTVACTYDDGVNPPVNAQCKTSVQCNRFQIGTCSAQTGTGTRTSSMMCPTTTGAGCIGTILVIFPDGSSTERSFAVDDTIATAGQCKNEFPSIPGVLGQGEIGKIVQSCTAGQGWNASDPVLSEIVRDDVERRQTTFFSNTSWVDKVNGTCNANNGFPTGACSNDGGTWFTVSPNSIVNPTACAANPPNTLRCGQQVVNGVVQPGPAPTQCRLDSQGQCECRCPRCTPAGTLVNLGNPNLFVLADATGTTALSSPTPWAAACEVTVTGN